LDYRETVNQEDAMSLPAEVHERIEDLANGEDGSLRGAFLVRTLRAVAALTEHLEAQALQEAVAAPTDYEVLLTALGTTPGLELIGRHDPLAASRLRGIRARNDLLAREGGVIGAGDAARLLNLTRQAVDKRRKAGRLLGIACGRHGFAYPAWQFTSDGVLPGLEAVLSDLAHHDPWMQLAFFVSATSLLDGETPVSALRRGAVDAVRRAARLYGEHGAG
jgi:hypothetical protein